MTIGKYSYGIGTRFNILLEIGEMRINWKLCEYFPWFLEDVIPCGLVDVSLDRWHFRNNFPLNASV